MKKKLINRSFIFTIVGILAGAFYREFTKFIGYSGPTSMSLVHTHLLSLGSIMFLVLGLSLEVYQIGPSKKLMNLFNGYTISVIGNALIMFTRGLYQAMEWEITSTINGIFSGLSGISHIILTITLIWIMNIVRKSVTD